MLSTVIDKLTALFSARLLVSSFFPLLVVTFVDLFLLHHTSTEFRAWIAAQTPAAVTVESVLQGGVVLVALAVMASLLATLSTFLRELLEGKRWPKMLSTFMTPMEVQRLRKLDEELLALHERYFQLLDAGSWAEELARARTGNAPGYPGLSPVGQEAMHRLTAGSKKGEIPTFADLQLVKNELQAALSQFKAKGDLDKDHVRFNEIFKYAKTRLEVELTDLTGRRAVRFGDRQVAPTSIGNMAGALSTYTLTRYGLSIDFLWTRLQKVLQSDADYYGVVQDAKAQNDGIVLLFWLTAVSTLFWLIRLAVVAFSLPLFLTIAVAGPLLCVALYHLAATSYLGFADLLRSVVDLYRFALLEKLHLPLPKNPAEEKVAWEMVNQWIAFSETPDVPYQHKEAG